MTQARNLSRLLNKDITTYMYTATAGQTAFTGSDNNSQTLTFDNQSIMVTYNGVMLEKGSEFTVATNTVTLLAGAEVNAEVNVIVFNNVSLGGYVKNTGGDIDGSITATGITSTGSITAAGITSTGKLNIPSHSSDPTSGHSAGDIYFNTTDNVAKIYSGAIWDQLSNKFTATGGTITTYGAYKAHTFTSSGTFIPDSGGVVDILIVAGGGGYAGDGGGGGGAGGMIVSTGVSVLPQNYTITIGNGGASCAANDCTAASGSNSTALGLTAIGGGGGSRTTPGSGGSGQGQGRSTTNPAGSGTVGQGNAGGLKGDNNASGGGGGAGAVGGNGSGDISGAGGAGLQNSYRTGSNEWYSVGGRGGIHTAGTIIANTTGYGGPGSGGGSGSTAVDNDGGDAGENGIVVIRYLA
jgi:hypothetical protein